MDREVKVEYLKKIRDGITVSQYSGDYVSISEKTGSPVYNGFIKLAYERAFEISQKEYQDKITVTKNIENMSTGSNVEIDTESETIVESFLQDYFNKTALFHEKMKMYCEFCDYYSGKFQVISYLNSKIAKNDLYQKYYSFYGTSGCSAKKYQLGLLEEGMRNESKEEILLDELKKIFKPGDILLLRDIKSTLAKIYEKIGITSTPKASILGNYFDLKDKRIVDKSTGKQSKGYEILGTRKAG